MGHWPSYNKSTDSVTNEVAMEEDTAEGNVNDKEKEQGPAPATRDSED